MSHYKWEAWRLGAPRCVNKLYFRHKTCVIRCQADIQLSCLVEKKKFLFTFTQETCFQVRGWTRVIVKYRLSSCASQLFALFQIAQIIHEIFDNIGGKSFWKTVFLYGETGKPLKVQYPWILVATYLFWSNLPPTPDNKIMTTSFPVFLSIMVDICFFSGGRNCPSIRKGRRNPNYMPAMLSGRPY